MRIAKTHQSILKVTAAYEQSLRELNDWNFQSQPPLGGWSYSEVYCHIFDASLLSLVSANACIKDEGKSKKSTPFATKLVLFAGMLPPGRKFKVPQQIASRVKKIDIATAKQLISDFKVELAKTYPGVSAADGKMKTKHPVLGYLNAEQWLKFTEIHLKHHLKQITRFKNSLR